MHTWIALCPCNSTLTGYVRGVCRDELLWTISVRAKSDSAAVDTELCCSTACLCKPLLCVVCTRHVCVAQVGFSAKSICRGCPGCQPRASSLIIAGMRLSLDAYLSMHAPYGKAAAALHVKLLSAGPIHSNLAALCWPPTGARNCGLELRCFASSTAASLWLLPLMAVIWLLLGCSAYQSTGFVHKRGALCWRVDCSTEVHLACGPADAVMSLELTMCGEHAAASPWCVCLNTPLIY